MIILIIILPELDLTAVLIRSVQMRSFILLIFTFLLTNRFKAPSKPADAIRSVGLWAWRAWEFRLCSALLMRLMCVSSWAVLSSRRRSLETHAPVPRDAAEWNKWHRSRDTRQSVVVCNHGNQRPLIVSLCVTLLLHSQAPQISV